MAVVAKDASPFLEFCEELESPGVERFERKMAVVFEVKERHPWTSDLGVGSVPHVAIFLTCSRKNRLVQKKYRISE